MEPHLFPERTASACALSLLPRGAVMAMDRSGNSSPEAEAVTLRPSDVKKLKEMVKTFQNVLGGIYNDSHDKESPMPGPSGLCGLSNTDWQVGERRKGF